MRKRPTEWMLLVFIALLLILGVRDTRAAAQEEEEDKKETNVFEQLKYRHIGPVGNRVSAVVGVPGEPNIYYFGAASGGIFKTTDGGVHWKPIFDDQPVASIGSLAIAASDPNVVWAGTGEAKIRSNISIGAGIYKSTDAGKSWNLMGLEKTGRIGRIVIHPQNPDIVLAAALGHCYGPQEERGVFRTTDGGETWQRTLFVDENTGASDIVMDPNNPRILFAGMWQMIIWTWGRESGGPGSGLYKSTDGGATWKHLTENGLPEPPLGKIALAMTPRDSNRIYALIETNSNRDFAPLEEHQGVLWRSDDGGSSWKGVNSDHTLTQRPHYYSRVVAAPDDADEVHFHAMRHTTSLDGGVTFFRNNSGGDHHDMWIDPLIPDRMVVGHDGGVSISTNRGESWLRPRLPIAQMYHVYTDNQIPYSVLGNRQDGPSYRGPSNNLTSGDIPIGAWHSVGGCESGFAIPDPVDNNIVWSGCYEGILERYDVRTGHARNVSVWPDNPESWPAGDLKYRFQWTLPVAISPHDHQRVYAGSQLVHQTTDGGHSWSVISPDLTTNDKSKQERTGGLTPDDASPTYAAVLFAIAESPLEEGLIWTGSNDGLLHVTRDGGANWENVTENLPDLPAWGTVSNIEPSRFDAATAYVTVDFHQVGNNDPFIYKTEDYGKSWTSIVTGIPSSVHSYVHCVREDPVRRGLLYAGTENALYVSFDDGASWKPLQNNLPHAPVHWITVQEHFNDLVVATYGRRFWLLDDITPLRQLTLEVQESDAYLFPPRPAYRFRFKESHVSQPEDPGAGKNPTYGASIHYFLKSEPEEEEELKIEIIDSQGRLVRTFTEKGEEDEDEDEDEDRTEEQKKGLPKKEGINRFYWDLRWDKTDQAKLRTKPVEHSHVRMPDKGWRSLVEGQRVAVLAAPGTYTVKLILGETELSQELVVRKDPSSAGSDTEVTAQVETLLEIREDINTVVAMVNEIEWVRKQIRDLDEMLAEKEAVEEILEAGKALDEKLDALEGRFFELRMSGGNARQDTLRWRRRLYSKLTSLAGYIGGSDFPPTTQQMEVYQLYQEQLEESQRELNELREEDIAAFNQLLRDKGIPGVIAGIW